MEQAGRRPDLFPHLPGQTGRGDLGYATHGHEIVEELRAGGESRFRSGWLMMGTKPCSH